MQKKMRKFELITNAPAGTSLPKRATKFSAGYDLCASEDILIPSLNFSYAKRDQFFTLEESARLLKATGSKATLVPTGITYKGQQNDVLDIRPRSSIATKNLLIIPNTPGTVDSDYYPNEIKVAMINLSPYDILIKKGERIAQAVIMNYITVDQEEEISEERISGFGSTGK